MEEKKYSILVIVVLGIITFIFLGVGFVHHIFWLISIGIGTLISFLLNLIICMNDPYDKDEVLDLERNPSFIIILLVCSVSWFLNWDYDRFITPTGNRQHLYRECPTLSNSKEVVEVSALEGFFHLCFKDCKTCLAISENIKEQNKQKRKEKRERENWAKREKHRIEMLDYFKKAINDLENCTDPAIIDDYYDDFSTIGMDVDEAIMEMTDPSNR